MKKFFSGIVFGIVLTMSFSAMAESMIGKQVDTIYKLFIDGQVSPVDAISIEGTSYLPVRASGELFGYNVDFINNQVVLTKKEVQKMSSTNETPNKTLEAIVFEQIKNSPVYPYETDLELYWKNKKETKYIVLDDNVYFDTELFKNYSKYTRPDENKMQTGTITLPDRTPFTFTFHMYEKYQKDIDIFESAGHYYIKASALDLDVKLENGILKIN